MKSVFPLQIVSLPQADISMKGIKGYIVQGAKNQVLFMEFEKDVDIPEHSHDSQWEIVVEGKVEVDIAGDRQLYTKGDCFFIPKGVKHSAHVFAGYASVAFFNEPNRYKPKI